MLGKGGQQKLQGTGQNQHKSVQTSLDQFSSETKRKLSRYPSGKNFDKDDMK